MSIGALKSPHAAASSPSPSPGEPPASGGDAEPSAFAKVLRGLGEEAERGERFMHDAKHATLRGELGPRQLLEIQEGVYRYGLTVDLTSKVVAEATNGLKTIIEGQ